MIPQFEPDISLDYANAVKSQIQSGWIGTSDATLEFENRLEDLTGRKFVISTTSGTTAIIMALKALDIKKKVLFPAYTFIAGANAAKFLNLEVELVDIKEDTLCMNPDIVQEKLNGGDIGCVIFVNHNGYNGSDIQKIQELCKNFDVPMIEDSAQCIGIPNTCINGDISILSFSVPKLVTTGQGGAVLTDNEDISIKLKQIRDQGDNWRSTKIHSDLGVNFKFNDILASLGNAQLEIFDHLLYRRKFLWNVYRTYIPIIDFGLLSTWMVLYKSENSDLIISALKENNIQSVKYYKPINHNPPFADGKVYDVAESVYKNTVYLPSSLTLGERNIRTICQIINAVG